jgi:2-polyprenyl-3-methyl-5-hydroxy-6-metoxy-1,4-benzoquinol methylase
MSQMIDEDRLNQLLGQAVTDMGAALNGALVSIGDQLGFWTAMNGAGPMTPADLARVTRVPEPYVNQWLSAQAASGYVDYDADAGTFTLTPEQAVAFAEKDSPAYLVGGYHIIGAVYRDRTRIAEAFLSRKGFGWHEHDPELFLGTEQFFRPGYRTHLLTEWIPALDGVTERLESGAKVADVGCGHGVSTALMATAYPRSVFHGFDYHPESITRAEKLAAEEGASANTQFMTASAVDYPGHDYDLICFFDCLHDMGDPVGAMRHARQAISDDGVVMLVEPFANDSLKDNLNPVGRVYYAASTVICTPASLSQDVGLGLGAQAGEARLRSVAEEAGFSRFRRAAETPFNIVLEARP